MVGRVASKTCVGLRVCDVTNKVTIKGQIANVDKHFKTLKLRLVTKKDTSLTVVVAY